jgi:protein-S-isoprenylcysteine O-methyltransferase Ste14
LPIIGFLYGVVSYGAFLASFLYAIGFVGNLLVPKSIDSGSSGALGEALLVNVALLGLFAIQHSVMARPAFKTWWTRIVPRPVERSTYVLISSVLLALLFWKWQAMPGSLWNVENRPGRMGLNALFWLGWLIALWSTFMIDHFDLFGLRQVYLQLRGVAYTPVRFNAGALYKFVRHPLMLGFLIAFWATPHMTIGHLLFSMAMTAYIFTGIHFEERDLANSHGEAFEQYRKDVPMIIPLPGRKDSRDRTP